MRAPLGTLFQDEILENKLLDSTAIKQVQCYFAQEMCKL